MNADPDVNQSTTTHVPTLASYGGLDLGFAISDITAGIGFELDSPSECDFEHRDELTTVTLKKGSPFVLCRTKLFTDLAALLLQGHAAVQ